MRDIKYSIVGILFLLFFGFSGKEGYCRNLIESIVVKSIPAELKDIDCPFFITFQAQINPGTNFYKTDQLLVKYRLIGDNGYTSNWRQYYVPKGKAQTDVFRRKIDPAAIADKSDFKNNPILKLDGDTAYYKGWSAVELMYQDSYRKLYKQYSNKAQFNIECKIYPAG